MKSLQKYLLQATREHWAVPHFNFTTDEQLKAIVEVCLESHSPVMVGTSEGESDFMGADQALALVRSYKEDGLPIFLNADHTKSVEKAKELINLGYDSVHIDLSKKSIDENIKETREVVEYAKDKKRGISIEGEVGYLPTDSSRVYREEIEIDPESLTKVEDALKFVKETDVDRLAPAVGNLHGISANKPEIDFDLIKELRDKIPQEITLVLHGGSGISDEDMKKAIELGFGNVHVSTEIRRAWKKGLEESLENQPEEYAPYRILGLPIEKMKSIIREKLEVFGSRDKF